jgi:hypothetical protein
LRDDGNGPVVTCGSALVASAREITFMMASWPLVRFEPARRKVSSNPYAGMNRIRFEGFPPSATAA